MEARREQPAEVLGALEQLVARQERQQADLRVRGDEAERRRPARR